MLIITNKIISVFLMPFIYCCIGIGVITYTYLGFTIRPRFEKLFEDVTPVMSCDSLRWGPKAGRFYDFVFLIDCFKFHKKYNTIWYQRYRSFDFPAHCSQFEIFVAKFFYFTGSTMLYVLYTAGGISLYIQEQHETDVWHHILHFSLPVTLITAAITLVPYIYLRHSIPPRFAKVMEEAQPGRGIPFNYYIRLMANYTVHQRHHTYFYEFLKPCDLIAHVSRRELMAAKFVYWMTIIFLLSLAITLPILFMRISEP